MTLTIFLLFFLTSYVRVVVAHPMATPIPIDDSASGTPVHARAVTSTSKAGIAGGGDAATDMTQFQSTGKVSWYYTWGLYSVNTSLEFVPMLWGDRNSDVSDWTDASSGINATIQQRKPTAILGFNEPQEKGQSNLTPQQGAQLWQQYIQPLKGQGLRLGSPAPSSAPSGKTWIQDFLTACAGGCSVDFIALHYYDVNATAFMEYLTDFHNTFQLPIWVTEWSCQNYNNGPQCSSDQIVQFLNQTQSFMDQTDWVERYSWFGILRDLQGVNTGDAMMSKDGQINSLGKQYIGAEAPQTSGGTTAGLPSLPTSAGLLERALSTWWILLSFSAAAWLSI